MKTVTTITLAGALALVVGQAAAVPTGFDQRSGFDPSSFVSTPPGLGTFFGPLGAGYPAGAMSRVEWSFAAETPSMLEIVTYHGPIPPSTTFAAGGLSPTSGNAANEGDVNTDGIWDEKEWWTTTRLTQTNNEIDGFGVPLWSMNAVSDVNIFETPGTSILALTGLVEPFAFSETRNQAPCNPDMTGTVCEDFYLTPEAVLDSITLPGADGMVYMFNFRALPVSNAIVDMVGGNVRIITREDEPGISVADLQIQYMKVVPAPATLALLGLGLAGMGFNSRRKK